jgi:hypothetical protein
MGVRRDDGGEGFRRRALAAASSLQRKTARRIKPVATDMQVSQL